MPKRAFKLLSGILLVLMVLPNIPLVFSSTGFIRINGTSASTPGSQVQAGGTVGLYFGGVTWSGSQFYLLLSRDSFSQISSGDIIFTPTFPLLNLTKTTATSTYVNVNGSWVTGKNWVYGTIPQNIPGGAYFVKAFDGVPGQVAVTDTYIAVTPVILTNPDEGPGGFFVQFTGYGYPAYAGVTFSYFDQFFGSWYNWGSTTSDASGKIVLGTEIPDLRRSLGNGDNAETFNTISFRAQSQGVPDCYPTYNQYLRGLKQVGSYIANGLFGNGTNLASSVVARRGDSITISGKWFHPGVVYLRWDGISVVGTVTSSEWSNAVIVGTAIADITGSFETTIVVPQANFGEHYIAVEDYETTLIIKIRVGATATDNYEPDNSFGQYSWMTVQTTLQSQSRTIAPAGDNDYIVFYASPGTYTFYTSSSINTYGYLYEYYSQNLLAANDDGNGGLQFRIVYTICNYGYYVLRVKALSGSAQGLYTLWFKCSTSSTTVVRGNDDYIYYQNPDAFPNSWNQLPSGLTSDSPAATLIGNELHVVVRSTDGASIWHSYVNNNDGSFSGWTLLSGVTPSAPTLTTNGTHLFLVVRGYDDEIFYRSYALSSRVWSGWMVLPSGFTCDSPAATILNNKLQIVVRSTDGSTIWHCSVDLSSGSFSGWVQVGGLTPSSPTLTTCVSRNEAILVVRGLDNVVYRNTWSGYGWEGWTSVPGAFTSYGVGAAAVGEELHLAFQGVGDGAIWTGKVNLFTGSSSGWAMLNRGTPSKPIVTG